MKDLLSIDEAAKKCRIPFIQAWNMVVSGKWTGVRNGPGSHCIRVRATEVEATLLSWKEADTTRAKTKRVTRRATA